MGNRTLLDERLMRAKKREDILGHNVVARSVDFGRLSRGHGPQSAGAQRRDKEFWGSRSFSETLHSSLDPREAPLTMFHPDHHTRFANLEPSERIIARAWTTRMGYRPLRKDMYFPRRVIEDAQETVVGFEYLNIHLDDEWEPDHPTLFDASGSHGTYSTYSTFAFVLQNEIWRYASPHIDLHVLTQGVRSFYDKGLGPRYKPPGSHLHKREPLAFYVHTKVNLDDYIQALMKSPAILNAARQLWNGKPLRRVVIPVQLTGHFVLIGWDQSFDGNGRRIHNRLFYMSSLPADRFALDPRHNRNLVDALYMGLLQHGFVGEQETSDKIYLPFAAPRLRETSLLPEFDDTDCFYMSMVYTFYLAMTEDISADNGEHFALPEVWQMLRTGYERFENSILELLEREMRREIVPVLLGPEWAEGFLNIRHARLLIPDVGFFQYSWEEGWKLIEAAPELAMSTLSVMQ